MTRKASPMSADANIAVHTVFLHPRINPIAPAVKLVKRLTTITKGAAVYFLFAIGPMICFWSAN
jgi:hypothetical protein